MIWNKICVVMPTRARPVAQLEAMASILGTSAGFADVLLAVDADDTRKLEISGPNVRMFVSPTRKPMLHLLHDAIWAHRSYYHIFGFTGDDVVYRTQNWDVKVWNKLKTGIGVAYGDDKIQGESLPTHAWFNADIVKAIGYVAPPCLRHYYFDNYLKGLTKPLGILHWMPDIVTEHRHHSVGGLYYDSVYQMAERGFQEDKAAFQHYAETEQAANIEKLKSYQDIVRIIGVSAASQPGSHTPSP